MKDRTKFKLIKIREGLQYRTFIFVSGAEETGARIKISAHKDDITRRYEVGKFYCFEVGELS